MCPRGNVIWTPKLKSIENPEERTQHECVLLPKRKVSRKKEKGEGVSLVLA